MEGNHIVLNMKVDKLSMHPKSNILMVDTGIYGDNDDHNIILMD